MDIIHFDKNKVEIDHWNDYEKKVFFKFQLRICNKEVRREFESYSLEDDKHGQILSTSDFKEIGGTRTYNHSFGGYTWGSNGVELFIYNQPINI